MSEPIQPPLQKPCPECGGKRILTLALGARVAVMPENAPTVGDGIEKEFAKRYPRFLARILLSRSRRRLASSFSLQLLPDSHKSSLEAVVCTVCGYTSFYTKQPEKLLQE